ncbi:ArdC-like ssDNA-binding domain-containing protein [Lacticaseibacillus paracasei]|uniref:ArdC-like ssDNA-binding domain-containing protein n=1 Tax=Lacticaseibacillus paracasei TaxID=1597 RepID=UPI002FF443B4
MPTSSQEKQPPKSTKELLALAEDGAKKVFSTDEYREYLKFISGFHQYSVRNQLLIYLQNPHATFVAGYHTWKNQYHRQVNQHEKGIRILAGGEHKYEKRVRQPDGTIKRVKESKVFCQPAAVFDYSQTSGEPIKMFTHELTGEVPNYATIYSKLVQATDFHVGFSHEMPSSETKGVTRPLKKEIQLRSGMSEKQTIKTLIHELAHSELHCDPKLKLDRSTMELEAESTAFIVCQHLGIDTSDYTFPYLAVWSKDKDLSQLSKSLTRIQSTAEKFNKTVDQNLEKIREKPLTLDQKIERAKTIATTENIAKKEQGLVQATQEKTR